MTEAWRSFLLIYSKALVIIAGVIVYQWWLINYSQYRLYMPL